MIRRPPRSTLSSSSAASDVYKRQEYGGTAAKMACPVLTNPTNVDAWFEENKALFSPPVCNKLMHKVQLNVMFVGGPNSRTDFHLDLGSEFFFQLKGNMELPTIQKGERKLVKICEGQVYLLPSRIPHSPQRPEEGSFGLVIEREREENEVDGLRWYTDFEKCDTVLYEKYFECHDLGKDLVPVVKEYKASTECLTNTPSASSVVEHPPFPQDTETEVPEPFNLQDWVAANEEALAAGASLNLFEGHPDNEFRVLVIGGGSAQSEQFEYETWFYQLRGSAAMTVAGDSVELSEGSCYIVPAGVPYEVQRPEGSLGLVVTQDPRGNRQ
eukprot:TRINITY_DN32603_c0_g1_i2.p1 TRINITY_DN32603_c0_g1~~TRINITY_DN32603_c0_g1_i2.p1  ORF type:complete len:327 (+),score=70.09 TRINITY_DN32603_c0_g1_i2:59-1039(+)